MRVQELDRVLDREDVLVARLVDPVDQRGKRGRLPRTGRAGDEHEPARLRSELIEALRHAELLERADPGGDQTKGSPDARPLEVGVDAEAGEARDRIGEVKLPFRLEQ